MTPLCTRRCRRVEGRRLRPRTGGVLIAWAALVAATRSAAAPPVACCTPSGACVEAEHDDCAAAAGDPHEPGSMCAALSCEPVVHSAPPVYFPPSPEPECFTGLFQTSIFASAPIVATDVTLAESRSITRVRWWGAYAGWVGAGAPSVAPVAFHVGLWNHAPAGSGSPATPFARPDALLDGWVVSRAALDETRVGCALGSDLQSHAGDAYSYSFAIPEPRRPVLASGTTHWFSISAMYVAADCECSADVIAPFGSPNAADVAEVNARIGCAVGAGDPACDASDVNCDGAVTARDVQIAQCQSLHGWTNPECCVPAVEFPWSVVTAPATGSGGVVILSPASLEPGLAFSSGDPLVDAFSTPWDAAIALSGAASTVTAPPSPQPESPSIAKNRYLSFVIPSTWSEREIAVRTRLVSLDRFPAFNGEERWMGPALPFQEGPGSPQTFLAALLGCAPTFRLFSPGDTIHVYGMEVVPSSLYELQAVERSCEGQLHNPACYSAPLAVSTAKWGDVAAPFGGGSQPNFADISAIVDRFRALPSGPPKVRAQLQPNEVNPGLSVSFLDISAGTNAFRGLPYSFAGPVSCP